MSGPVHCALCPLEARQEFKHSSKLPHGGADWQPLTLYQQAYALRGLPLQYQNRETWSSVTMQIKSLPAEGTGTGGGALVRHFGDRPRPLKRRKKVLCPDWLRYKIGFGEKTVQISPQLQRHLTARYSSTRSRCTTRVESLVTFLCYQHTLWKCPQPTLKAISYHT